MSNTARKKAAYGLGREAEGKAAQFLRQKGYEILGQRVLTAGGEIDLVAKRDAVLVFVEVKARRANAKVGPLEAVDPRKQRRLAAAAAAYLQKLPGPLPVCRFDVIAVEPANDGLCISHLPDAFRPEA